MSKKETLETLEKQIMEFEIRSSPRILYPFIATADGLSEWFADAVLNSEEGVYSFEWDGSITKAKLATKKDNALVRYQWVDGEFAGSYFQFEIMQDEITSDVALVVTDHSRANETEENRRLWEKQIHNLKHVVGS